MLKLPIKLFTLFLLTICLANSSLIDDQYAMAHMKRQDLTKAVVLRKLRRCVATSKLRYAGRLDSDEYWEALTRCKRRLQRKLKPLYEII